MRDIPRVTTARASLWLSRVRTRRLAALTATEILPGLGGDVDSDVSLVDIDLDRNLGAVVGCYYQRGVRPWINNGDNGFADGGNVRDGYRDRSLAVGDLYGLAGSHPPTCCRGGTSELMVVDWRFSNWMRSLRLAIEMTGTDTSPITNQQSIRLLRSGPGF